MPQPDSRRAHPRSWIPFISATLVGLLVLSVWAPRPAAAQSKGKFLKDVAVAALSVLAAKKVKQSWDERQLRQAEDALDAEADPFRDCMLSLGEAPATQTQQTAVDKLLADLQYQRPVQPRR